MLEGCEGCRLGCYLSSCTVVSHKVGSQDLGHHQAEQPVIPGQVGLMCPSASEQAYRIATRDDLLSLLECPRLTPWHVGVLICSCGHHRHSLSLGSPAG